MSDAAALLASLVLVTAVVAGSGPESVDLWPDPAPQVAPPTLPAPAPCASGHSPGPRGSPIGPACWEAPASSDTQLTLLLHSPPTPSPALTRWSLAHSTSTSLP